MNDTRCEIIRLANELIKSVGYNAFSYADISRRLTIKNAAIHYYFPAKSDLGVAIIKKDREAFNDKVREWEGLPYRQQYENYIRLHDNFIQKHWVCIVGALCPEYDTLPGNMQTELQLLLDTILNWLANLLEKGREKAVFTFDGSPKSKAYLIHSALLSSLQMNKVLKNDVYHSIQQSLLNI